MGQRITEIRVQGKAEVEIEADQCTVILDFSKSGRSRSAVMRGLNLDVDAFMALFADETGIARLSNHSYSVDEHWNADPADPKTQIQVAEKTIHIDMAADDGRVKELTDRIAGLANAPSVKLEYRVSDTSQARIQVREDAVRHATQAAQEIARSLGLEIGGVSSVHYQLPDGLSKKITKQALGLPVWNVSSRADKVSIADTVDIVFLAEACA